LNVTQLVPIDNGGDIGIQFEGDYDLGVGYKMPWYAEENELVMRLKPYFKLGGIVHIAFFLYFMRIHLWNDLIGSELFLFDLASSINIVEYNKFCWGITSENYNFRLVTHIQVDFNECMFGMFGVFINDAIDCEWKQYWIDVPLFNEGLSEFDATWLFLPKSCITADSFAFFKQLNQNR
jgi:hypothetical protein